jgi:hypothetical protein
VTALARQLPEFTFYYKLRSEEYENWRQFYDPSLGQLANLRVIDSDEISLYEYMTRVSYLLSINSTAIYEGIAFGVVPLIYRGPYYEDVVDLVDAGCAFIVDDLAGARQILESGRVPAKKDAWGIFADDSENRMRSVLRGLVESRGQTEARE